MKLIHISDTHLTIPGERMGGLNPHRRLAQALADLAAHHRDADRLIISGDLTHWGEAAAYDALRDALADVAMPVRLMIGNHDHRETFLSAFPDQPTDANGYVNHAEDLGDLRLIYLDSCAEKTHAGHFGADRCEWLDQQLNGAQHARIFLHHNPMLIGLPAEDKIALIPEDRALFRTVIERHQAKIDYIHFGHVHAAIHGTYCGIPFASVPSTGNQSIPDFAEQDLLHGGPLAPSYFVILADGRDTTIHQIPFTWDGPIQSTGTGWDDWAKPS